MINRSLERCSQTVAKAREIIKRFVLNHDNIGGDSKLLFVCLVIQRKFHCLRQHGTSGKFIQIKSFAHHFFRVFPSVFRGISRGTYHNMNFDVSLYALLSLGNKFSTASGRKKKLNRKIFSREFIWP